MRRLATSWRGAPRVARCKVPADVDFRPSLPRWLRELSHPTMGLPHLLCGRPIIFILLNYALMFFSRWPLSFQPTRC